MQVHIVELTLMASWKRKIIVASNINLLNVHKTVQYIKANYAQIYSVCWLTPTRNLRMNVHVLKLNLIFCL